MTGLFQGWFIRPPKRIFVVLVGVLFTSLQGWIRFILSLQNWYLYQSLGVYPGPWYLTFTGLAAGVIYLAVAFFILTKGANNRMMATCCLLAGLVGVWFDKLFAVVSPAARTSVPFALVSATVLTLAAVTLMYWDTIIKQKSRQEK